MDIPSLQEILAMSKDKIEATLSGPRAKQAKLRANLKMAELEEKISSKQQGIFEQLAKKDLDFDKIMDEVEEIGLLELRYTNYQELLSKLFPEAVKAE